VEKRLIRRRTVFLLALLLLPGTPAKAGEGPRLDLSDLPSFSSKKEELSVRQGAGYAEKGDFAKAFECFEKAILENPSSIAHDLAGQLHESIAGEKIRGWDLIRRQKGAFRPGSKLPPLKEEELAKEEKQALESYAAAVRAHPNFPGLRHRLGSAALRFGSDPAESAKQFVRAVELRPEESADRIAWLDAAIEGGAFDAAQEETERLKEEGKLGEGDAWFLLGRIEFGRKNFLKSIDAFRRAASKGGPAAAHYYAAQAQEALPQKDAAAQSWRLFIRKSRPVTLQDARRITEAMQRLKTLEDEKSR
jgi:tetratricopeptide (TPR) repeat protein